MDKEGIKKQWEQKKGEPLTAEEEQLLQSFTMKEVIRVWEMVHDEKDWQAEIAQMRQQRLEDQARKEREEKEAIEAAERKKAEEAAAAKKAEEDAIAAKEAEAAAALEAEQEAEAAALAEKEAAAEAEAALAAEAKAAEEADKAAEEAAWLEEEKRREAEARKKEEEEEEAAWAAEEEKRMEEERIKEEAEETARMEQEAELEAQMMAAPVEADGDEEVVVTEAELAEEEGGELEGAAPAAAEEAAGGAAAGGDATGAAATSANRDADGKFVLPGSATELAEDPRTGLPLVGLPAELKEKLPIFSGNPLIHWAGEVEKMNHNLKWDKRHLVVTNYCMFVAHAKDGFIARSLEIPDIDRVLVGGETMCIVVPREFDLVIRLNSGAEEIIKVLQAAYQFKKKTDLPIVQMEAGSLAQQAKLKKPKHWQPDGRKHVHSKEELFKRLQAMNDADESLLFLNLKTDPRTGLPLVDIPKDCKHNFVAGPFKSDPLLHFFASVDKVNHKLGIDKRYCLVTNACLYLTYFTGNLQRCVIVHKCTELLIGASSIALRQPDEFDTYLKLPGQPDRVRELADVLKRIYKFKVQKDLPIGVLTPEAAAGAKQLNLNKPDGWKPRFAPVLQRKDLVEYLRKLGIKPDDAPVGSV